MIKLPEFPFAAIRWADAHCMSGTAEVALHEIHHGAAHYTRFGYILRNDEAGITVMSEMSDESTYRNVDFIPAAMIVEVQYLKLSKPKKSKHPLPSSSTSASTATSNVQPVDPE